MDADLLSFDCWIYGEQVHSIFQVEISPKNTVGGLKIAIWEWLFGTTCSSADARTFELYSVAGQDVEAMLQTWKPEGKVRLNGRIPLSDLLPADVKRDVIIAVNAPNLVSTKCSAINIPCMTLNCWVRGQGTKTVFSVEISSAKTIATLKDAIKEKKPTEFQGIDANNLALYKISTPYDDIENASAQALLN